LRKLEEAGYVTVNKEFVDRKPVSWYGLTESGRAALKRHLAGMEALIRAASV
jgi:DNA-binding PadR family transcriptional regulator